MTRTTFKLLLSVSLALFLVACAAQLQIKDVEVPSPEQGIIFGRIDVMEDGKPKKPWGTRIFILPPGGRKAMTYSISGDGSFYWGLEPGDYTILGFELTSAWDGGVRSWRIVAKFTVSEGTKSVYIGNLKLVIIKGMIEVSIEDNYLAAVESFKNRFPEAQEPDKSLALPEEKLGTYRRAIYICSDVWYNCTKRYRGVTPLNPEVNSSTDSLLPTFEWKPSSMDDVSYDLVVYEAASYPYNPFRTNYMRGRLVAYEEDIKEAKFHLKSPLQANSKYFWSVRLRLNDVVSYWSTFSHFEFYIFAWTSGSGEWFSFTTPSE